jgi:hypothetical protein
MAGCADDERLAPHARHQAGPLRLGRSGRAEVGQLADLVRLHPVALLAPLAPAAKEPGDQFLAAGGGRGRRAVVKDRPFVPFERDAAEPCYQWFPARPLGGPRSTRGARARWR